MSEIFEHGRQFFGVFSEYNVNVSYDEDVLKEGDQVIHIEPRQYDYINDIDIFNIGLPTDTLVGVFTNEDGVPVLELYRPPRDTDE